MRYRSECRWPAGLAKLQPGNSPTKKPPEGGFFVGYRESCGDTCKASYRLQFFSFGQTYLNEAAFILGGTASQTTCFSLELGDQERFGLSFRGLHGKPLYLALGLILCVVNGNDKPVLTIAGKTNLLVVRDRAQCRSVNFDFGKPQHSGIPADHQEG